MKIMLSGVLLLALIVPVRAEDKPAVGVNSEIKAERQEYRKEMKENRQASSLVEALA